MSTLDRARAFAKRSTLSAAMSILPFALAAVNADAAAVTLTADPYTPPSVVLSNGLSDQGAEYYLLATTVGDVDGQKLAGSGLFLLPRAFLNSIGTQANPNVTITAQGGALGTFTGDAVGVGWDFTLQEASVVECGELCLDAEPFSWTITYSIDHSGGTLSRQVSGAGGSGPYAGSSSISGLAGISPLTWSIVLSVDYTGTSGFFLTIPENSVAIPAAIQAVPEPGTVVLMGAGFAILAFRRFRRA